ncbi:MAG: response regulator transcription factor [Methylococcales symbiont of Hymedesmia sp. n. MRB-2018]|nr:MAG: response regulator transcription factor [Methylococcales symbiont of Hymedesmia sp. n. MRB-2018]KAF3982912.1 MAG: response regulator transcription factor [Methylococcales symbiont of Hymedesmia sp. n. MRB-2018]
MKTPISVMLADDHAVVRSGLRRLLEQNDNIKVVAEAESGKQAYHLFGDTTPDVLVMDISMPGIGGLEALRRIIHRYNSAKVVIFSMHESATFAVQALTSGAISYVAKSSEAQDLIQAIVSAAEGISYLNPILSEKIDLQTLSEKNPIQKLTSREFGIFRLLAEGKTVDNISTLLNIGKKTVANHQTILKQKLGITSPVELVRLAIKHGLIES